MFGGARTGCIRIKGQRHLPGQFFQLLNVLFCNRAADTGYGLLCPMLVSNNRIHIPLNNHHLFCEFNGIASHIHGVQHTVLLKQERLRRVQMLWLVFSKSTPTKADHPSSTIPNGKNQAMPKVIIDPATITTKPSIAVARQSSIHQFALSIASSQQEMRQAVPLLRSIAKTKGDH